MVNFGTFAIGESLHVQNFTQMAEAYYYRKNVNSKLASCKYNECLLPHCSHDLPTSSCNRRTCQSTSEFDILLFVGKSYVSTVYVEIRRIASVLSTPSFIVNRSPVEVHPDTTISKQSNVGLWDNSSSSQS